MKTGKKTIFRKVSPALLAPAQLLVQPLVKHRQAKPQQLQRVILLIGTKTPHMTNLALQR